MLNISPKNQLKGFNAPVMPNCICVTWRDSWTDSIVDQGIGTGASAEGIVKRSMRLGAHATEPLDVLNVCITTGMRFVPWPSLQ